MSMKVSMLLKKCQDIEYTSDLWAYVEIEEYNSEEIEYLFDHIDDNGQIHELVDGLIDIYNYGLRQWAVDNYNWVEEAISEGLCEGVDDYHKLIQCGQYVYYRDLVYNELGDIKDYLLDNCCDDCNTTGHLEVTTKDGEEIQPCQNCNYIHHES